MTHRSAPLGCRAADQDGATPVSAVLGVGVFLLFLLFAVQVSLHLFTATVVQAAAVDGANHGAGAAQDGSLVAAETQARAVLGGLADGATVEASVASDAAGALLRLTVTVDTPSIVSRGLGLSTITREATARVER